jgi:simple sugar transport system ATP-binding protein
LSHIPEDRHKYGLVLNFTVSENMALQSYFRLPFTRRGFINRKVMDRFAERLVTAFDVRTPSIHTTTRSLSGGNQQKAIIAREIERDPELLIAAQPTRGLDVGAIEFVHKQLLEHRDRGKAVLLVSFELDEILNLADRIVVLYEGELVGEVLPHETNDQELGLMMSGGAKPSRKGAEHE